MEKKDNIPPDKKEEAISKTAEVNPANKEDKSKALETSEPETFAATQKEKDKNFDEDSEKFTSYLAKINLNEKQKEEVKTLLTTELESAVLSIKEEVKKESQDTKKDFLTFFGLFASFVTFLSIEVQLFKNNNSISELLGVSAVSLSFVMFFALVLNDVSKGINSLKDLKKPAYVINILFLIAGVLLLFIGGADKKNIIELKNNLKEDSLKIVNLKNEQLSSIKTIKFIDSTLKQTNTKMDSLKIVIQKRESAKK